MAINRMRPVVFTWTGDAMVPHSRYKQICNRQFVANEEYPLVVLEERSRASHNAFFAAVSEGWHNLPETIAIRFPTEDHLRRWALVQSGFFDEREFECESAEKAKELAAFIRKVDTYAVIHLHERKIIVRDAKSQSLAAMGKDTFQASKTAVLDLIESLTGVKPGELMRNAGQSA